MAVTSLTGGFVIPIGVGVGVPQTGPTASFVTMDAAAEAIICIGQVLTSDGGSHTIDTTGSSSLGWRSGSLTFANGSTIVKVGLAAVDTSTGPPGRAANASNVITFDVSKSLTGGGGGITANAWQTHVPDTGSKTIANGDLVAFAIQMTARGGTDAVNGAFSTAHTTWHRPLVTQYLSAAYANASGMPIAIITFSDGALGFFADADIFNTITSRTFNSAGATKEYGQLFQLPFPMKIYGIFGWVTPNADFDVVLYSDPLGTPVAERTASCDANTVAVNTPRRVSMMFSSPYSTTANQVIVAAFKPGATNITTSFKTLASAAHRVADPWGTSGYGVSRASAAFSNANVSLEHYYIGLLAGGFDAGGSSGRAMQINNDSLVG